VDHAPPARRAHIGAARASAKATSSFLTPHRRDRCTALSRGDRHSWPEGRRMNDAFRLGGAGSAPLAGRSRSTLLRTMKRSPALIVHRLGGPSSMSRCWPHRSRPPRPDGVLGRFTARLRLPRSCPLVNLLTFISDLHRGLGRSRSTHDECLRTDRRSQPPMRFAVSIKLGLANLALGLVGGIVWIVLPGKDISGDQPSGAVIRHSDGSA